MPSKLKPDWTHVPDEILDEATAANLERKVYEQVWDHIHTCKVCRDRYWEKIEKSQENRKKTASELVGMVLSMLSSMPDELRVQLVGDMPASLKAILAKAPGIVKSLAEAQEMNMEDIASRLLAQAEQVSEFEALTVENLKLTESEVFGHIKECPGCCRRLIRSCEKRKASMPHLGKLIDRVVAFIKKNVPPEIAAIVASQAEPQDKHNNGGETFFAN